MIGSFIYWYQTRLDIDNQICLKCQKKLNRKHKRRKSKSAIKKSVRFAPQNELINERKALPAQNPSPKKIRSRKVNKSRSKKRNIKVPKDEESDDVSIESLDSADISNSIARNSKPKEEDDDDLSSDDDTIDI